ncbi:MarR family transcriptional regulator [Rhodococcus sp. ABRD24]|uniref:MarR family winged helix-turn-helix transcriptional regulator n=1 Tax=Rhodococcus sp. ABRD24 TaxID=2507582 RepID=UPI001F604F40|nr:MarR family transcriptional regulator [Rhodococcus sp. ABRD24]
MESELHGNTGHEQSSDGLQTVHRLRGLTVELNVFAAEFARRNGLNPTDLRAVIVLLDAHRAGAPATPGLLGEQLGINSASTTALIDRLERADHIRRVRDSVDRRRVLLEVTPSTVDLGWSFFGPLIASAVDALESFSPAERDTIEEFLQRMLSAVTAVRATAGQ